MLPVSNNEHWLKQLSEKYSDKTAVETSHKKFTYLQLYDTVMKAADYFSRNGIAEGNRVALLSNNSIEFVISVNALWLLGAVPVPINLRLNPAEINKLILHSQSSAVVDIDSGLRINEISCKKKLKYKISELKLNERFAGVKFKKERTALLMYSSGSTGMPKCVELTFKNLYASAESFQKFTGCVADDIWLASLPFYHIGGFSIITRSLLNINTVIIPQSFAVGDLTGNISVSFFSVVPTVMQRILNAKIKPWKKLKSVFIGGGPVHEKLILECIKNNWPVVKVYGATETSSMITAINAEELKTKSASAGKPLKNVKIKIVDESGKELQTGMTGEIVVQSDSVAKAYFNSSNKKIRNGKYFTGDYGSLDEEGFLYVYGRKDDMVISGGENFNLKEIEEFVKTIDIVEDCATVKISDDVWGESYLLVVEGKSEKSKVKSQKSKVKSEELKVKSQNGKESIASKLKENFARYKHPAEIIVVNQIPRNELGKLNMKRLKEILNI